MKYLLIETAKYLLMVLGLVVVGFIVVLIGFFILVVSPILPLFQNEKIKLLWEYKDGKSN